MNNKPFHYSTFKKNIITFIFGILIYLSLNYFYVPLLIETFKKNNFIISNYSTAAINLQTIFFSILCLLFLILTSFGDQKKSDYIKKMVYALILISFGLLIQVFLSKLESKMSNPDFIQNELEITYKILFLLPTVIIFPMLFKNAIDTFKLNNIPLKYALFRKTKFDTRLKRVFANLIDLFVIYLLSYLFSKIIVLVPETAILIIFTIPIYFFTFETTFHTTIGKFLFGFKIYTTNNNINFFRLRIFIKSIIRFFPLYQISILFNKRGLHEYLSQTYTATESIKD